MRGIYLTSLIFSVLAFSLFFVSAAFATETLLAEWLLNAATITVDLVEVVNEFNFTNLANGGGVDCSLIYDGFVEKNGGDIVTEVLNLAGIRDILGGTPILCLGLGSCVEEEDAELFPELLPWLTEMILFGTSFHDLVYSPSWHIDCLLNILLTLAEEECTIEHHISSTDTNVAEGVEDKFTEPDEENAHCGTETEKNGVVTGSGTVKPVGGGTLTVSSE
jgi:hypothetical protein